MSVETKQASTILLKRIDRNVNLLVSIFHLMFSFIPYKSTKSNKEDGYVA